MCIHETYAKGRVRVCMRMTIYVCVSDRQKDKPLEVSNTESRCVCVSMCVRERAREMERRIERERK